jgi:hypothetical protein
VLSECRCLQMFVDQGGVLLGRRRIAGFDGGRDAPVPDLPLQLNGLACIRSYRPWKNRDGTRSKLATGRWAEGQGRPQGVGKRWRGWYVADDGKQHTQRFRIEVEAEARTTWSKSSNSIFQQCNSESCSFQRSSRASTRNVAARIRRRVDCSPSAGGTKATIESFTSMGPKCHTKPIVGLDVEANPHDMRSSRC